MEPLHADLVDCGFEPQTRARSNTWPLPRPENFVDIIKEEPEDDLMKSPCGAGVGPTMCIGPEGQLVPGPGLANVGLPATAKKNSSRRNAWGNLSYADLITQAITTAPDKRLTLSQIYEWMVHNVPYFKDKGDSNSSAGWKNSIRHNLSLHNRFMRVQNEGTGKSSWWMINPDAKPGKSARRRATSMETSKFEKRRGRVKKKVEALRNGLAAADASPSPCSSVSEGLDLFPDSPLHHSAGFQLSPDFRPRASSNASSCGRLSPIPAVEPDWSPYYAADQLAGNLEQNMKLQQDMFTGYGSTASAPPPPYPAAAPASAPAPSPYLPYCPAHRLQGCSCGMHGDNMSPGMSPTYQPEPSPDNCGGQPSQPQQQPSPPQQQQNQQQHQQPQPFHQPPSPSELAGPTATPVSVPVPQDSEDAVSPGPGAGQTPTTMMGQLMGALNPAILDDLNLNIEEGLDCNVDEVIKQELSLEGSLDFNFSQHSQHTHLQPLQQGVSGMPQPASQHGGSAQAVSPYTSVTSGHSWVH